MRRLVEEELRDAGYEVRTAAGGDEALQDLSGADLVVTDLVMPGMRGEELLARVRSIDPDLPVVVMTAFGSIDSAVDAIKAGAYNYIAKPCRMDQLLAIVAGALRERRLRCELHAASIQDEARPLEIVCESPGMKRAVELVLRAAPSGVPCCCSARAARARSCSRARCTTTARDGTARSSPSTARRSPNRCSRASCSVIARARSRTPTRIDRTLPAGYQEERSSSTRSATCRRRSR
jgi:CheY-like chemotaxis protein